MNWATRFLLPIATALSLVAPNHIDAQAVQLGKIIANVRVGRGDFLSHPVLISLEMRGSAVTSTYNDEGGRVGFYNLAANEYKITVNDDAYEPFSTTVEVDPTKSPVCFVQITLIPTARAKDDPLASRVEGSNPFLVDLSDYYRQFPKKTIQEFKKGVEADHHGNQDQAIEHYQKALSISPGFYAAHNNLGTLYLSRQDFNAAQTQFEAALKGNQNDGQAYFNLGNVFLLTRQYDAAEREISEGLRRRPDSAFGLFLQGSLYSRTGQPALAEKSLLNALQFDATMSQAHLQLVNLYVQQKRTPDAIKELEAYLKAFPDTPFSPKARELLKRLLGDTQSHPQ